ncbi:MAG: DUF4089 domain-containing protein [Betaproteobacteria bacterium]
MASEDYVKAAAEAVSLPIPAEYFAGVVMNFQRSEALAKVLMDFPMPMDVHPAPNYEP